MFFFCQARLDSMSQIWTEKDKRLDSVEEELEQMGASETESQVRMYVRE